MFPGIRPSGPKGPCGPERVRRTQKSPSGPNGPMWVRKGLSGQEGQILGNPVAGQRGSGVRRRPCTSGLLVVRAHGRRGGGVREVSLACLRGRVGGRLRAQSRVVAACSQRNETCPFQILVPSFFVPGPKGPEGPKWLFRALRARRARTARNKKVRDQDLKRTGFIPFVQPRQQQDPSHPGAATAPEGGDWSSGPLPGGAHRSLP